MKSELVADVVWKTALLLGVAFIMVAGLIAFNANRTFLVQQRPYFAQGYIAIARYSLTQLFGNKPVDASAAGSKPASPEAVPVLLYHGIEAKPDGENISISNFAGQMTALKQAGYHTIGIEQYYGFMRNGQSLPSRPVLITFDDARKDSYYPAQPILKALGFRATMFVITKASLVPYSPKFYLDPDELAAMRDSGVWDLQPHAAYGHFYYPVDSKGTRGHFYNNKLWLPDKGRIETDQEFADRVLWDLETAKSELQDKLGSSGIAFAFPFNEFGAISLNYPEAQTTLLDAVKSVYPIAFYQVWPNRGSSQNYPQDPNFLMKRILVDSSMDSAKLLQRLSDSRPKSLPYRSALNHKSKEWLGTWGENSWGNGGLVAAAGKDGRGAAVFLDGGGAWRDYSASARLQLKSGELSRIYGRYYDDRNYLGCTFSADGVLLEETVAGVTHKLAQVSRADLPLGDLRGGISMTGNHVGCTVNGQALVSSDTVDPSLGYGSIGFSTYAQELRNAQLLISDLVVDRS